MITYLFQAGTMDLLQCYQKLGLKPDCSWKELQSGYRRLVQKWHPDRYQQRPDQQHVAAHRMLEINEAYGILAQYYRQNGRLPFETLHRPTGNAETSAAFETGPRATSNVQLDLDAHLHALQSRMANNRVFDILPWLIIAGILGLGYYYLTVYNESTATLNIDESPLLGGSDTLLATAVKPAPVADTGYFTYGDPPGRVYVIQGEPTHSTETLWEYGDSAVRFENGVVSSWYSAPGDPLRARDTREHTPDAFPKSP